MNKPKIFISHIQEESKLAQIFKEHIEADFLGMMDIFVSSDETSIRLGSRWLNVIDEALLDVEIMLILCSQQSVKRPWVNFEAGAGWVKKIPVIPICHTNIKPSNLPIPLSMLQAIEITEASLEKLYVLLSDQLKSRLPKGNFAQIVGKAKSFENEYGFIGIVKNAISLIIESTPKFDDVFKNGHPYSDFSTVRVDNSKMGIVIDNLQILKEKMLLNFRRGTSILAQTPTEILQLTEVDVQLHSRYWEIQPQIFK